MSMIQLHNEAYANAFFEVLRLRMKLSFSKNSDGLEMVTAETRKVLHNVCFIGQEHEGAATILAILQCASEHDRSS